MMRALSLLIAMFIATTAAEAQIKYRIGTFVADTAPITWPTGGGWQSLAGGSDVSLGTLTSTSDIVVQIADQSPQTNGNPSITADLGLLRLIAGSGSVAPRRVRVWIANAALDPLSGLIDTSSQSWTPGIHDWTGRLQCLNSSHVKWEELADAVHLNANISHNYGDTTNPGAGNQGNGNESIDCGSIIRFSTNGIQDDPSDVEAGQINGFFRGRRNYVPVGHSPSSLDNAVGVIVARHGVWGAICAGDAPMDVTAAPVLIIDDELINGASLGSADNLANIGSVKVGPNVQQITTGVSGETAYGIDAHLAARRGVIREILSTGEIMYDIEAGNGVWVVRQATAENDPIGGGSALAYNVDDTKHGMKSKVVANLFTPGYLSNKSPGKGAIRLIEVVGPVTRSIIADNVNWDAPNEPSFEQAFVPSPLFHRRHRGILVWNGGIDGSVDIRYNLEQADIIAAGLKGGVTIGLSARGSVVAYGDPEDPIYKGIILFLQIGYIPDYSLTDPLHASEYPRDLLPPAYAGYSRGLRGSAVPPIYMTDPYGQANWKSPRSSTNPTGPMVFDGGAADCVVRFTATDPMGAGGATPAYIYNMHQYNPKPVSPPGNPAWRANPYRPRVEAPLAVGEFIAGSPWFSFVFGHWPSSSPDGPVFGGVPDGGGIESGVVWSGRVGSSVAHWFVLANSVMARAIGSNADVWLDTTAPDGTGRCAIDGDMNGRLHLHGLPSSRSVLIGERLGTLNDVGFLDTLHDHAVTTPVLTLENSPRGTHGLDEWPAGAGAVQVLNDAFGEEPFWLPGLDGQIVIDRWNTTGVQREGSHCAGSVLVADTTTSYGGTLLEPGSFYGSDYFLARYDLHAGPPTSPSDETLGTDNNGGAVGLAPYAMHAEDSLPSNRRGWGLTTPPVLIAELPNLVDPSDPVVYYNRLRTRFYGPILSQADGGGAGLRVQFEPAGSYAGFAGTPEDVTDEWEVTFPVFAPFPRDIMLQPRCDQSYRPGFYRVVRAQDVPVPPEGTPPTDRLRSDLTNTTGAYNTTYPPDMQPVAEFAHYFRLCDCGQADIGITGGVPGEDCVLDNNDFIVFIDYYFTNNPIADVGSTGGVPGPDGQWDNNDFIVYIDLFFAGCAGKFYGACEPGMRMAGRAASGESRDVADEAGRLAGIQASIRSLLTAAAERMPQSDRARIMGLLQSGRELTRDDLLGALDAMFAPQQESR